MIKRIGRVLFALGFAALMVPAVIGQNTDLRISDISIINGRATSLPRPEYKEEWKNADIKGVVYVSVTIDEQGNVTAAEAVDPSQIIRSLSSQNTYTVPYEMPHPLLQQAAVEAAQKAKFRITIRDGVADGYKGLVVYNFSPTPVPPPPPPLPPPPPPAAKYDGSISAGVMNGRALSMPLPEYPAQAKAAKVSGSVSVQVIVDESGNVISAQAASGHPMLRESAVIAAREAKFSPMLVNGEAKKVSGVLVYNFTSQVSTTTDFDSPKIVRMGVLNGRATRLAVPQYPADAKASRVFGSVSVQVVVNESGNVISANAVSGHPSLRRAAEDAARESFFSPTKVDGTPVKISGIITYNFVL